MTTYYLFEQMSDAQAAAYDASADDLFFLNGSASTVQVQYNPQAGLNLASLTLTNGDVSHTFNANALAGEELHFFGSAGNDVLAFGSDSDADTVTLAGTADASSRYYALGGADVITGSAANDQIYGGLGNDTITGSSSTTDTHGNFTESDVLNGGAGGDSIVGGAGNDHIYGNDVNAVAGDTTDGADHLSGLDGNDYIQGNAGADTIDGGTGNDRLYGGADADSIAGGDDQDYLQGNKGTDSLDGGNGNDTVHGGADADTVAGGAGNDWLYGDAGNDTIHGDAGYDTLVGGDGKDTFTFATGTSEADIANVTGVATASDHDQVEVVWDFTHGTDHFDLGVAPAAAANVETSATNFANIDEAYSYANSTLAAHLTTDVEVLQVGSDTALFWSSNGTSVDSVALLHGVTASSIDFHDFV